MGRRTIGLGIVFLLGIHLTALAQETQSVLSLKVIDSQEVDYGTYSVFYDRVEPPVLKPQKTAVALPSLTIPSLSTAELEAVTKAELKTQVVLIADATVYDGKTTLLRWWQDGGEYIYLSNINFNYLRSLCLFETQKTSYFVMFAVADGGTLPVDYVKSSFNQNGDGSQFVLISQPKNGFKTEASQFMQDIHAYYNVHKSELIVAYQESEKARIAKELWDKEHPPQLKDIVIQYFPIRSSMLNVTGDNTK